MNKRNASLIGKSQDLAEEGDRSVFISVAVFPDDAALVYFRRPNSPVDVRTTMKRIETTEQVEPEPLTFLALVAWPTIAMVLRYQTKRGRAWAKDQKGG